ARLGPEADVTLYVEGNNTAAVKTYRRLGFVVYSADVAYAAQAVK
ncbi:MAG: mycothiol acetyltransferase, partial [Mycobacterium sp.]|nr:mycothiol acetyltransferase [Mycobacterium sp.]